MSTQRDRIKCFSTKDSRDAFIEVCSTDTEYKSHYNTKVNSNSSIPPYITIIGSLINPEYIMCDFENITYKMFTLKKKAIDICFKTYYLFSLRYPTACQHMWQFINQSFYSLKDDTVLNPATKMLLTAIKGIKSSVNFLIHVLYLLTYISLLLLDEKDAYSASSRNLS